MKWCIEWDLENMTCETDAKQSEARNFFWKNMKKRVLKFIV